MQRVEIGSRKLEYRDLAELRQKLVEADKELAAEEAAKKRELWETRYARKTIGKLLGESRETPSARAKEAVGVSDRH